MERNNFTEEQKYLNAKRKVKKIKGFYVHFTVYLIVNIFLIILRIFSIDGFENLWEWQTFNTAIFWGIGIVFHAFSVFGMNFLLGKNWEERKIKEFMEKDKRDVWE